MAALRRVVESRCAQCGERIVGTTRRVYCGDYCRLRAHRGRKVLAPVVRAALMADAEFVEAARLVKDLL
jgi:hypothetical protein